MKKSLSHQFSKYFSLSVLFAGTLLILPSVSVFALDEDDATPRAELQQMQYRIGSKSTWGTNYECVHSEDPICIAKGTRVGFKALPNPNKKPFPAGAPIWTESITPWKTEVIGTGAEVEKMFTEVSEPYPYYDKIIKATHDGKSMGASVQVVDLSDLRIKSGRTCYPTETLFEMKQGEFYDAESTFEFKLDLNIYDSSGNILRTFDVPEAMKWEYWETSYLDSVVQKGPCYYDPTIKICLDNITCNLIRFIFLLVQT